LNELVAEKGIQPVSMDALEAHKRSQVARFQPSFWNRHRLPLTLGTMLAAGTIVVGAGLADGAPQESRWLPVYLMMAWMLLVTGAIAGGVFGLAGPEWEERWIPANWLRRSGVPEPIAEVAETLQRGLPGSTLVLGELVQRARVLDPYLMLEFNGERVCLGVWDDEGIICRAS